MAEADVVEVDVDEELVVIRVEDVMIAELDEMKREELEEELVALTMP